MIDRAPHNRDELERTPRVIRRPAPNSLAETEIELDPSNQADAALLEAYDSPIAVARRRARAAEALQVPDVVEEKAGPSDPKA